MSTEAQSSLFPEPNFSETPNSSVPQRVAKKRNEGNALPDAQKPVEPANSAAPQQPEQPLPARSSSNSIYLKDKEVAERYSVSKATIWRWTNSNPNFPKAINLSNGAARWSLDDLLAFEALKKGEVK
jgi:prophage regulatory protein